MAALTVNDICSIRGEELGNLVDDFLFFLNFFTEYQQEQIVAHFIEEDFLPYEIRERFADKPDFIIRAAHRLGWDADKISKFILGLKSESKSISFNITKKYVEGVLASIKTKEEELKLKGKIVGYMVASECKCEQCIIPSKNPKKEMLERFFKLSKDDIIREIPRILDKENEYTEDELHEILTFIIKNEIHINSYYFHLLDTEERMNFAIISFTKNKRYDLIKLIVNVS